MRKKILAVATAVALSGCAAQPITIDSSPRQFHNAPFQVVEVEDYVTTRPVTAGEQVWVNGWVPIHMGFKPELHEVFSSRLKSSMKPSGNSGTLSIAVIDTGLFMEKNIADDIAFVGIFVAARDRGFKCSANLNVKINGNSTRQTFEHSIKRGYFKDSVEIRDFVTNCHEELTRQIFEYATKS